MSATGTRGRAATVTAAAAPANGAPVVPYLDLAAMQADCRDELDAAWRDVTGTTAYIGGPFVDRFEEEWAAYCGRRHAIGVANGTDALVLTLRALGAGPGDEIVVPANTFAATAEAVVAVGAVPRFVDVDPATLLLTPELADAAIGPATAGVIAVDLFGQPVDLNGFEALTQRRGVFLVEDAAQAHGARDGERRAGTAGIASCFSFYPGKNLGAFGDGGAVVTDNDHLADTVRMLGDHGRPGGAKFDHRVPGVNSRLDGLQAAVLSAKLPWLDRWNDGRRRVAACYGQLLEDTPVRLVEERGGASGVFHVEVVQVDDRDGVRERLGAAGIPTGIHYPVPCHLMPAFAPHRRERLPVAEVAATRILSLPMTPHLTDEQVHLVCRALLDALA